MNELIALRQQVEDLQRELKELRSATAPAFPFRKELRLTPKARDLLALLIKAHPEPLRRDRLEAFFWPDGRSVGPRFAASALLGRTRQMITGYDVTIENVWGIGYKITNPHKLLEEE